ncbi:MFS transporter [Microbacterium sp. NPDC057659]|uniref:MFS transporter n=1 Tax=Microbacterium sp. NPDC057659 TaxID=3346198 RepID=UPI00367266CF
MSESTPAVEVGKPSPIARGQAAVSAALDKIGFNRAHKFILAMVLFGAFFDVMEENAMGAVGPMLQELWNITTPEVALLQTATILSMIAGKFVTGILGDFKGRKFALSVNLAVYCLGALICALAPGYAVLLIGRIIVGIGLGGEIAAAITILSELVATKYRGSVVASVNIGAGGLGNMLSFGFAALILGPMTNFFGGPESSWRWMFGLLVLPAAMVMVYRRYLPETPRFLLSQGDRDGANRTLSILASARLGNRHPVITEYVPAGADGSIVKPERPRLTEVFRGELLKRTAAIGVASWMSFGAQSTVLVLMPVILVGQGMSITNSLVFTMIMNIGSFLGAVFAAWTAQRFRRRIVMTYGAIAACAAALAFVYLGTTPALVLLFGGIFQFCVLLQNSTIFCWSPELFPTRIRAFGTAVIAMQGNIAGALVPLIGAIVYEIGGVTALFTMIAAMYVISAIVVRFAPETFGLDLEEVSDED